MNDAKSYLADTAPATEALFNVLNNYGWQKMRTLVNAINSKNRSELEENKSILNGNEIARDVIAGAILQIAFIAIKQHGDVCEKPPNVAEFEKEINNLARSSTTSRLNDKDFSLPAKFCIGREIGYLPIGIIIYAGRNQYNHPNDERLSCVNEIIFNSLHNMWPDPPNNISFNLYDQNIYYSYSILAALGWTDSYKKMGKDAYTDDMKNLLNIEH